MRIAPLAALTGRKALALMAGGLVLGVGVGATTLAAWVDQESVWGGTGDTGTTSGGPGGGLSTSLFNLQQSADGVAYLDAPTTGAQLAFSANAAALSPGTTTYAYVYLRTVQKSVAGTVTLSGADLAGDSGLRSVLTYGARVGAPASDCASGGSTTSGTELVPPGTPLGVGSGSTSFRLAAGTPSAAGAAKGVCFAVSAPSTLSSTLSGKQVTPTWHFDAISD